jgi:CHAT domain-containing protein/Tfp pilus assembly protein PilF
MRLFKSIVACALFSSTLLAFSQAASEPENVVAGKSSTEPRPGIVIEKLAKNSVGEKAGLQKDDILLHWFRDNTHGEIESPLDLYYIATEQASRGAVTVEGIRAGKQQTWIMNQGFWGITARPNLGDALFSSYTESATLAEAGHPIEAADRFQGLAAKVQSPSSKWLSSWFLFQAASVLADAGRWGQADDAYRRAFEQAQNAKPEFKARLLQEWARSCEARDDFGEAGKHFQQSLAEWNKLGSETMVVAGSLFYLGLEAFDQGDLGQAQKYYLQALAIQEKLAPGSVYVSATLSNLGVAARRRGDLAAAETYYRKALVIEKKLAPGSHNYALLLNNLAMIAKIRGDTEKAEAYAMQALGALEQLSPGSLDVANALNTLGRVFLQKGDMAKAEDCHKRALAIIQKAAPGSLGILTSQALNGLGDVARSSGNPAQAVEYYQQSLAIEDRLTPGSIAVAAILNKLGVAAQDHGDFDQAEGYYQQALAILEKRAPGSEDHAESLAALADIMRRRQRLEAAAQFYEQALNSLESQTARLGGGEESRTNFRTKYTSYYTHYIDLLLAQKKPELALQVFERLRARTLLESMASAHVDIRKGVDPALVERERSLQESLNAKSNRRMPQPTNEEAKVRAAAFDKEINDLLAQYRDVEEQIRVTSPAYAALTQPRPLAAKEIQQQLLDPDTLLLEYSLGEQHSYVFAVTSNSLDTYALPGRKEIDQLARRAYAFLTKDPRRGGTESRLKTGKRSQALSDLSRLILGPIVPRLKRKRLLIVSDGALQYIPFASLPTPGTIEPLVIRHEIVNLPSASVLALLRRQETTRTPARKAVAIMADPVFVAKDDRVEMTAAKTHPQPPDMTNLSVAPGGDESPLADEPSALDRSAMDLDIGGFPRLLFTRREADAIDSIAGKEGVLEALDFDASKSTALSSRLKDYRIIHFATHGLLNNDHPELSGLVFSLVDRQGQAEDGFLRMFDIYNMDLKADLVVLSACQTALGKEIGEEGLVGLTRGFMYAGAPRVVASLWKVDDEATAALMKKFYEGMLHDHQTPAQALRAAQQWMRTQPAWRAPYYWAGFILQGEWR